MSSFGCQSMIAPLRAVLLKHPREAFVSQEHLDAEWERYGYIDLPDYDEALKEYEYFESILKRFVDDISYVPGSKETGLDSLYAHDPVQVAEGGAILMNMGKMLRQGEPSVAGKYLETLGIPIVGSITGLGKMEGGDVLWLDKDCVALGRGYRTNDEGIRQFLSLMPPSIESHMTFDMPHDRGPEECLHLMSVVSLVDTDLAVVYSPLMPIRLRQYLLERGYSLIEVPAEEYETLGCNVLTLAPRVCVILEGNATVSSELRQHGAEVHEYPGKNISWYGTGGPTCLTRPLLRRW
ncbi:MAG: dimethylarginine dimethylaminohydrolase family protein [Thermovirga sp.]